MQAWELYQAGEDQHCSVKVQRTRRSTDGWQRNKTHLIASIMPNMLQHSNNQIHSRPIYYKGVLGVDINGHIIES